MVLDHPMRLLVEGAANLASRDGGEPVPARTAQRLAKHLSR